jgi:uncharacterized protein involved in outer membrane biogenesis
MRTRLLAAVALIVLAAFGLALWARAALGGDAVRNALAAQLSRALGQPVTVGRIGTSIFPRLAVSLGAVTVGDPARVQMSALHIGTSWRALLSRRIENASVRLDGARIQLPLPPLTIGSAPAGESSAIRLVSVDEIELNDVQIVSGNRTLNGDIAATLRGQQLTIEKATLEADGTRIEASGDISDLSGPTGTLQVRAGALNLDALLAFAGDFSSGLGSRDGTSRDPRLASAAPADSSPVNLTLTLAAGRATLGKLTIEDLAGRAVVTPERVTLAPVAFGLFGGRYEGTLAMALAGSAPTFHWQARLSGIDVAAATAFAGRPDTISGRLTGNIDLKGRGADASTAIQSARGTARFEVADGVVRNLGLVRAIVIATSMRAGAGQQDRGSPDEPFSRLSSTFSVAGGSAETRDLRFESANLALSAAGALRLDGRDVKLSGRAQLSDALSAEAGRDLLRYTQEQGRVTLPITITGPVDALRVRVDTGDLLKRAIRNRAEEEAQDLIERGLGGLIRK